MPRWEQPWVPCAGDCCWRGCVKAAPGPAAPLAGAEPRDLWQAQDRRPISFPSLLSHITSMHLNAEALVMPVAQEKPAPPALRSFTPLSTTIPCDFHILNLRMLQAEVSWAPGGGLVPTVPSITAHPWLPSRMNHCPRQRQP